MQNDNRTNRFIRGARPDNYKVAREFRKEPTTAEDILWGGIRRRQVMGVKFRRQHPVGKMILDFYCPERKLVIEVDGGIHDTQVESDEIRTLILGSYGYTVIRFRNEDILHDLDRVLVEIAKALADET